MRYLNSEQHYIDRYDLGTIEECLSWYWNIKDGFEKERNGNKFKKYTKEKFDTEVHKVTSYTVNIISIQRYRHKADTIKEWVDKDRKTQEKFDNATPPDDIYCKQCGSPTEVTSKDLLGSYDENSKVLFMLECVNCKKRQALYEDGTEWHYEPPKCPKCGSSLNHDSKHTKDKLTTIEGEIDFEQFKEMKREVNKRNKSEQDDLDRLNLHPKELTIDNVELQEFCQEVKDVLQSLSYPTKSLLIRDIIDKIVLKGKTNEVEVMGYLLINHLNIGYELIGRDSRASECR